MTRGHLKNLAHDGAELAAPAYVRGALLAIALLVIAVATAGLSPQPAAAQARIIGGSDADPQAFGWVAALLRNEYVRPVNAQYCAGTLIAPKWVLTAAHCLVDFQDNSQTIAPDRFDVLLGQADLTGRGGTRHSVKAVFIHPAFTGIGSVDMGLIQLNTASSQTPVRLLYGDSGLESPGDLGTVVGWGLTQVFGYPADRLQMVTLPITTDAKCDAAYAEGISEDILFCAGFQNGGADACDGDSGGPMVVYDARLGGPRQAGIVSFGRGCALPDIPGVYTRVSAQTGWIESVLRANDPGAVPGSGAELEATFKRSCNGLICDFDAGQSRRGNTPIVEWRWQLADGREFVGERIRVEFFSPGYEKITLTVTDALGNTASRSKYALPYDATALPVARKYAMSLQASERESVSASNSEWVNGGRIEASISGLDDVALNLKLMRYDPMGDEWYRIAHDGGAGANRYVSLDVKPGRYRWVVTAKAGQGEFVLDTIAP